MFHSLVVTIYSNSLLILLLIILSDCQCVFAYSPSFLRSEYTNVLNKWYAYNSTSNSFELIPDSNFPTIPALNSVAFSSDGHFLNATFFLSSDFQAKPSIHRPSYVIWIDSDSNNQTGYGGGADYAVIVEFHNDTHTWSRIFEEFSSTGPARIIDRVD